GLAGSPELVVDAAGNVVRANAVLVDGLAPVIGLAADRNGDGTIDVGAIANGGNGGIMFYADDVIRNAATPGAFGWPLFDFRAGLSGVSIIDASGKVLRINGIDVISSAANAPPLVRMVTRADQVNPVDPGTPYTLQFDLQRNAGATLVDIQKRGDNTLQLNGTINNPTGWTHILNTLGDITSTNPAGWVVTNVLDIEATDGRIGTTANRVNVALVQSIDRGEARSASDDRIRTTRLYANAADDIALRLQAYDRVPADHALRPAALTVYVDRVESTDGSVDLLLDASVEQSAPPSVGNVRVQVIETMPPGSQTYNALHSRHFLPDGGTLSLDPAAYASGGTPVASTYRFEERQARPEGTVRHFAGTVVDYLAYDPVLLVPVAPPAALPVTSTAGLRAGVDIVVAASNPAPGATRLNVTGFTDITGSGHIDVLVNGFITLEEQAGDLRVGDIRSTDDDVTLISPAAILDANPADDAFGIADPADVTGRNITLTAKNGGSIGTAGNFLETNLLDNLLGVLRADAPGSIFVEETSGDLRVHHVVSTGGNVTLVARAGSILDAHDDTGAAADAQGRARDAINVSALNIALDARGSTGSIGLDADDLDIDSRTGGQLFAQAGANLFVTEVNGELDVIAARALGGALRLTTPDTGAFDTENLVLRAGGSARIFESGDTAVSLGEITAFATIALWIGDNVSTHANSRIVAGTGITVRGDTRRVGKTNAVDATTGSHDGDTDTDPVDVGRGTQMDLRGTIGRLGAPASLATFNVNAKNFTQIFGHDEVDTFTFHQTKLDANTRVHGSYATTAAATPDGEDRFVVNQLQSMHVFADGSGDTLTLDGQTDSDRYTVNTTGSQSAGGNNYVINVLDSGPRTDAEDRLEMFGVNGSEADGQTDDIFLLRRVDSIPNEPGADSPAFVALLHGSLAQARDGSGST
ncbi:MAG TPA: hypothetical protein VIP10_10605, partial [Burkholderiaceae bacterium]